MASMGKGRLEAFSDGVLAIIITIMVLEIKAPEGHTLEALRPLLPVMCSYVVSFVYVGIYWNNHHHLLHSCQHVSGGVMWANLHLLFWLSLIPVVTAWVGEHEDAAVPAAMYAFILLMAGVAWLILQTTLVRLHGKGSSIGAALRDDRKGPLSALLYLAGIGLAFVRPWLAQVMVVAVALLWLIPDRRLERAHQK